MDQMSRTTQSMISDNATWADPICAEFTAYNRARSQVQNFEEVMEPFGGTKIVAGHREAPKARALAGGLGVLPQKILKKSALSLHLSAFQGLNLKY